MSKDTFDAGVLSIACLIEHVCGIWKFVHEPSGSSRCRSLPGHLLHLVVEGHYQLRTNGREYAIGPNDVIYYHEMEEVEWLGNRERVTFLSVGFSAPKLPPLGLDMRVFPSDPFIRKNFHALYEASLLSGRTERNLKIISSLSSILGRIEEKNHGFSNASPEEGSAWWTLEDRLRRDRRFRPTLEELADLAHCSRASIVRNCRRATGQSPMSRIRQLRMEEAKGLLRFSTLNVTQVAEYLGYGRVNEFSRDYSHYFKHPPSREGV
jgi:AraC-like DNA-binding protein